MTSEPNKQTAKTPGQRIRAAYLARGMNRSKFAKALGVDYKTAFLWDNDKTVPNYENLTAIGLVLGIPVEQILDTEGESVTGPQFAAWAEFADSAIGKGMTDEERVIIASMHFPKKPPTAETYRSILLALRVSR